MAALHFLQLISPGGRLSRSVSIIHMVHIAYAAFDITSRLPHRLLICSTQRLHRPARPASVDVVQLAVAPVRNHSVGTGPGALFAA